MLGEKNYGLLQRRIRGEEVDELPMVADRPTREYGPSRKTIDATPQPDLFGTEVRPSTRDKKRGS
jgi:hypothetical protein